MFSELESLSRLSSSSKPTIGEQDDFQDHWVGERAKEAVAYLKDLIGKQVPQVYTITSKGNLLTSLMFATEETCGSGELKVWNGLIVFLLYILGMPTNIGTRLNISRS